MNPLHYAFGYAGLIPFVVWPVLFHLGYFASQDGLLSYAALIFSFLGGVQWMATLSQTSVSNQAISNLKIKQTVSILMMLWAWVWLLVPQINGLFWAGVSFWGLWLYERTAFKNVYAIEFMQMRRNLSFVAGLCLMLTGLI